MYAAQKDARHRGEQDADGVEVAASAGEQRDARGGQPDPQQVHRAPGPGDRDPERAEELDRDGDPERYPVQGEVEAQVHAGEYQAERHAQGRVPTGNASGRWVERPP